MKTKFEILLMVLLMACAPGLTSCDDDLDPNTFEGAAAKYVGHTYQLTGVHWSGTSVDLDGDGVRRWDLMEEEMGHLVGFDPYRHDGVVQIHRPDTDGKSQPALDFLVALPFPVYTQIEGKWVAEYIMYLSVFPKMVFQGHDHWMSVTYPVHNYKTYPFVGKIDNLVVTHLKPDGFDVSVVCCLVNEQNELEENLLIYSYRR